MNNLSQPLQRLIAVALLLLVLSVVVVYGILPLFDYYQSKFDEAQKLQAQLLRMQQLLNNEERINSEIERIEELSKSGDLFLAGSKKAIASANLREFVNEALERSGGRLVSSQEYEAAAIPSATAIGLRLQLAGEVENLVDLLHELENARPVIFIDTLTVSSNSSNVARALRQRKAARNLPRNTLDIRMDIVGFLAGERD